jgi:large subunit ribosomal protein LP1
MSTTNTNADTSTKINPEQAVAFAALILADDNLTITPEKLQTLLTAAGIQEVEPIWTTLFANALKGKDVKEILTAVATCGPRAESGEITPHTHRGDGTEHSEPGEDICEYPDDEMEEGMFGLFD